MPHRNQYYSDAAAGLLLTVGALIYYRESYRIKVIADTTLDAAFFPRFLAAGVILLSLVMVGKAARTLRREGQKEGPAPSLAGTIRENLPALETLSLFGLYVFSIEKVGFLIATAVYIFGQCCILAPAGKRRYPAFALLGAAASAAVYCVFKFGFQLMVPPGILG